MQLKRSKGVKAMDTEDSVGVLLSWVVKSRLAVFAWCDLPGSEVKGFASRKALEKNNSR